MRTNNDQEIFLDGSDTNTTTAETESDDDRDNETFRETGKRNETEQAEREHTQYDVSKLGAELGTD
eukprot:2612039-Ditylum_brightwellii.AAC.1